MPKPLRNSAGKRQASTPPPAHEKDKDKPKKRSLKLKAVKNRPEVVKLPFKRTNYKEVDFQPHDIEAPSAYYPCYHCYQKSQPCLLFDLEGEFGHITACQRCHQNQKGRCTADWQLPDYKGIDAAVKTDIYLNKLALAKHVLIHDGEWCPPNPEPLNSDLAAWKAENNWKGSISLEAEALVVGCLVEMNGEVVLDFDTLGATPAEQVDRFDSFMAKGIPIAIDSRQATLNNVVRA